MKSTPLLNSGFEIVKLPIFKRTKDKLQVKVSVFMDCHLILRMRFKTSAHVVSIIQYNFVVISQEVQSNFI